MKTIIGVAIKVTNGDQQNQQLLRTFKPFMVHNFQNEITLQAIIS